MKDLDQTLDEAAGYLDETPLSEKEKNDLEIAVSYELSLTENEEYDHSTLAFFIGNPDTQQEN